MSRKTGIVLVKGEFSWNGARRNQSSRGPGCADCQGLRPFPVRKLISWHSESAGRFWHGKCMDVYSYSQICKAVRRRPAAGLGEEETKEVNMLGTILVILVVLWALGFFAFHVGGLVHVLLVIALVVVILRLLQGKKIF
jgi:hypothetical protein